MVTSAMSVQMPPRGVGRFFTDAPTGMAWFRPNASMPATREKNPDGGVGSAGEEDDEMGELVPVAVFAVAGPLSILAAATARTRSAPKRMLQQTSAAIELGVQGLSGAGAGGALETRLARGGQAVASDAAEAL